MATKASKALITGASSGIGAVYAERLARRGYELVLIARRADRLRALAAELQEKYDVTADVTPADLSTEAGIELVERRLERDPGIDILINNAGIPAEGPISGASAEQIDKLINVNVRAVARLAAKAAAIMKGRNRGTIVNIASVVGLMPEATLGLYGPTKAFVISLSQNLQAELASSGVYVQAVLPAATRTDIWVHAGRDTNEIEGLMEVSDLVDAAMSGFDQRELVTIPSLDNRGRWESFEAQRHQIVANLANSKPGARYLSEEISG